MTGEAREEEEEDCMNIVHTNYVTSSQVFV